MGFFINYNGFSKEIKRKQLMEKIMLKLIYFLILLKYCNIKIAK